MSSVPSSGPGPHRSLGGNNVNFDQINTNGIEQIDPTEEVTIFISGFRLFIFTYR